MHLALELNSSSLYPLMHDYVTIETVCSTSHLATRTSYLAPPTSLQTFFSTKSTDQGKGFGLSLSYDIIKARGWEFIVKRTKGRGTTFTINLPI